MKTQEEKHDRMTNKSLSILNEGFRETGMRLEPVVEGGERGGKGGLRFPLLGVFGGWHQSAVQVDSDPGLFYGSVRSERTAGSEPVQNQFAV